VPPVWLPTIDSAAGAAEHGERAEGKRARQTERGLREVVAMSEPRMLRPMDYGEIFNEAFDLYKRNFGLFAGIGAIVYIPYYLFIGLTARYPTITAVAFIVFYIPMAAANGAIIKALADRYLGREATIAGSWGYVFRRLIPYFLTAILAILLLMLGVLLLCVPGIIVAFWLYFLYDVIIVEDRFYVEAIQRSRELSAGQWGRIFVVAVLSFLLYGAVMLVLGLFVSLQFVFMGKAGPGGPAVVPLWVPVSRGLAQGVTTAIVAPIVSLMNVILYFDVRVRKEGYDIDLLAQEMGESPRGGGPSIAPA
jgi:hypothetical protein